MNLRRLTATWKEKGPTAVIEHGANPGLISHFTKQGLIDIGQRLIADKKVKAKAPRRSASSSPNGASTALRRRSASR